MPASARSASSTGGVERTTSSARVNALALKPDSWARSRQWITRSSACSGVISAIVPAARHPMPGRRHPKRRHRVRDLGDGVPHSGTHAPRIGSFRFGRRAAPTARACDSPTSTTGLGPTTASSPRRVGAVARRAGTGRSGPARRPAPPLRRPAPRHPRHARTADHRGGRRRRRRSAGIAPIGGAPVGHPATRRRPGRRASLPGAARDVTSTASSSTARRDLARLDPATPVRDPVHQHPPHTCSTSARSTRRSLHDAVGHAIATSLADLDALETPRPNTPAQGRSGIVAAPRRDRRLVDRRQARRLDPRGGDASRLDPSGTGSRRWSSIR